MRPTALFAAALLTAGFTTWYLTRIKDKLFDDINVIKYLYLWISIVRVLF